MRCFSFVLKYSLFFSSPPKYPRRSRQTASKPAYVARVNQCDFCTRSAFCGCTAGFTRWEIRRRVPI
jgi:hypothetical protein